MWQTGRSTWRPRNTWWRQETCGDGDSTVRKEGQVCPEKWAVAWCQPAHRGNWTAKIGFASASVERLGLPRPTTYSAQVFSFERKGLLRPTTYGAQVFFFERKGLLRPTTYGAQVLSFERKGLLRRTALKSSSLRGRVCSDPRRTALKSSPLRGRVCSDPRRTALKSSSLRGRVCSDPRRTGSFVCCLLLCKLTKTNKFWYRCVSLLYWQSQEILWMWLKNLLNYQLKIMTGGLYRLMAYGKG